MTINRIHTTIMPRGQLYEARLDGEVLCVSRTPFLSAARNLLERGYTPGTILTMSHAGADAVSLRSTLGAAAKLIVIENETAGPRFGRYRAPPAEMLTGGVRGKAKTAGERGPAGVAYATAGAVE